MGNVWEDIKNNPVRLYSIVAAALAIGAFYLPGLPVALVLALVAAVLGVGGEVVRHQVTPMRKVEEVDPLVADILKK